ncbi:MAG: amino acid ABC transporter substrate-binding protein [Rhodoblastus sp.]|nr:MAG: amino acid ABC transporter substrate-binding protein [Rhodoblastus sp.]
MRAAFSLWRGLGGLALAALAIGSAAAQSAPPAGAPPGAAIPPPPFLQSSPGLTGALSKIARLGAVTLGYREASVPFSFLDRAGRPIGYSMDICAAIVEEIGRTLGRDDLKVAYEKVTSETRLQAVADGKVDLECGSTTANAERAKIVSFSPMIFVAGAKVMVARTTPWADFRSLKGKTVAATSGTTTVAALKKLDERFGLGVKLVEAPDHEQAYQLLVDGKVDGVANDDVLLAGLIAQHKSGDRFKVAGELLSYDPYGIAYAHADRPMREAIERAFRTLAKSNEIDFIYDKWFKRPLPNGEAFRIPMSPQLEEAFRTFETEIEHQSE